MPNGYDDYSEYDYGEEYGDPIEQAAAAAMLADEMRREEEALTRIGQGGRYSPEPSPVSRPVLAGPGVEDWRSYVQDVKQSRGVIPLPPTVDYEAQAAAEQARAKYEAQTMYNFLVGNGMAPAAAMAQSGAGMFGTSGITAPKPMSEYQQGLAQKWKDQADLAERRFAAQQNALKAKQEGESRKMPKHLADTYAQLKKAEAASKESGDPRIEYKAWRAVADFEEQYPQYFGMSATAVPQVSPPTSPSARSFGAAITRGKYTLRPINR